VVDHLAQFSSQLERISLLLSPHQSGHGGPALRPHASCLDLTTFAH